MSRAGKRSRRSQFLDDVMDKGDMPIFRSDADLEEQKRFAWRYKMDLLEEWDREKEALAWVCLECDLHPQNVEAAALKERLKRRVYEQTAITGAATARARFAPRWGDVAGMRELKAMLERDVIQPMQEPEIYKKYRIDVPNGLLLYGPPGCGKTFIVRQLAKTLGFAFIEVKPSDLASIYIHGTQEKIGNLFADARSRKPAMVFFDEIDASMPKREDAYHSYAAEVNEFLVHLNEAWKSGVFVVGASNTPGKIDPAVLRPGRLDKKIFVAPPDFEARVELLRISLQGRPQEELNLQYLSRITMHYTCAEITFAVTEAARSALPKRRPIRQEDFVQWTQNNPPQFSADEVETMRKI